MWPLHAPLILIHTMKKIVTCTLLLVLAGCTASRTVSSLRDASLLRHERRLSLTHAQVQRALFEHQRLCGRAPEFALNAHSVNEATVTYAFDHPPQLNRTVLVDLQQVYGWDGLRLAARAYASLQVTQDEIERVFQAMLNPTVCPAR